MLYFRKISTFFALGLLLSFTACEDTAEEDFSSQSKLLTGSGVKIWKVTSVRQNTTPLPQSDCIMDDLYTFAANKNFELDEGANKCNTSSAQKQTGLWELSNSTITIRQGGTNSYLKIKSLTSAKMVTTSNNTAGKEVEVTFQAQ